MVIEQRIYNYVKSLTPENYSVKRSIMAGNGYRMVSKKRVFEPKLLKSVSVIKDGSIEHDMWDGIIDDLTAYLKRNHLFSRAIFKEEVWENGDWISFKEKYVKESRNSEIVFLITSYEKLQQLEEQEEVAFAGHNNLVVIYVEPGERRISKVKGVRCFYLH